MCLWSDATVERAEDELYRRILAHGKWHEGCPIQFNLAIVDNDAAHPDRCRLRDCITTTLGEKRQISPRKLPGDRDAGDRLFRQLEEPRKPRTINQKAEFAHDHVDADHEPVAPNAADDPGKIKCCRWRKPVRFGCLPAPKRDRQLGVAKFSGKPRFRSANVGLTIASSRVASARWIGVSHERHPEGFARFLSKPKRSLNFLQRAPDHRLPAEPGYRRNKGGH